MNSVVSTRGISRVYKGNGTSLHAVREVSLAVAKGEFVAIMGQSGSGKSTLLNLIGTIDKPDAGEVWMDGARIDTASETRLAKFRRLHIGIVFQFFNLIHNLDVQSNIELPGQLAGLSAAELRTRTRDLMDSIGIIDLARKMPGQLSGGQRQRVAICRALINRPTLLLADEPTGALDQENGQGVLRLFRRLHTEGQTIVMVTHDPKVAAYAERILSMQDGMIVAETRPSDVETDRLMERFLGARKTVG
jgi:putative ABC transport system ATP-binding protein